MDVDDFLEREVDLSFLIHHEESQTPVARTNIRIWYRQDGAGGLVPDLEIIE